jgi:hypothetical protein
VIEAYLGAGEESDTTHQEPAPLAGAADDGDHHV